MAKKQKRFVNTFSESTVMTGTEIWVDRETGVNYLYIGAGYGGGLTVLVDRDGKPVVTPIDEENEL